MPGLRLNLPRGGVSASVGRRGAWLTVGRKGVRTSVGIPGTGLYWTETLRPGRGNSAGIPARAPADPGPAAGGTSGSSRRKAIGLAIAIAGAIAALLTLAGCTTPVERYNAAIADCKARFEHATSKERVGCYQDIQAHFPAGITGLDSDLLGQFQAETTSCPAT